jgi:hypothetical protein
MIDDDCGDGKRDERFFDREDDDVAPETRSELNESMTRDEAYSIAIDFGMVFGVRLEPRRIGQGYSARVPMEILKRYLPQPQEPPGRHVRGR